MRNATSKCFISQPVRPDTASLISQGGETVRCNHGSRRGDVTRVALLLDVFLLTARFAYRARLFDNTIVHILLRHIIKA